MKKAIGLTINSLGVLVALILMSSGTLMLGQAPAAAPAETPVRSNYVLGPSDQIVIRAAEMEELSEKPFRIGQDGTLILPVLGSVKAAGLTVEQFEGVLLEQLKKYVRVPQVSVTVLQVRAAPPVYVIGAFRLPGAYPLQTRKTLSEMMTTAGGVLSSSTRRVKVTRKIESGPIPLPGAVVDASGKQSSVEISLGSIAESISPEEDIVVMPYDTISAERAEQIYISGRVGKAGPVELGEREYLSMSKLISISGGLAPDAKPQEVRILRQVLDTSRRAEIIVNVKDIFAGKASDYPVYPNDVVYVPQDTRATIFNRASVFGLGLIPTIIALAVR